MGESIADIRHEYVNAGLDESSLAENPFDQFQQWFAEAEKSEGEDVIAMTLATASRRGIPSARIVLLKGVDDGFLFFTNYNSHKGRELEENPHAALVFWWRSQNRQVRIEGRVEQIASHESDSYFASRPHGSKISAVASPQSQVIESRQVLQERVAEVERSLSGSDGIPRPENWGGYRLLPEVIEFWQGRENRLHDRLQYRREGEEWIIRRLGP